MLCTLAGLLSSGRTGIGLDSLRLLSITWLIFDSCQRFHTIRANDSSDQEWCGEWRRVQKMTTLEDAILLDDLSLLKSIILDECDSSKLSRELISMIDSYDSRVIPSASDTPNRLAIAELLITNIIRLEKRAARRHQS